MPVSLIALALQLVPSSPLCILPTCPIWAEFKTWLVARDVYFPEATACAIDAIIEDEQGFDDLADLTIEYLIILGIKGGTAKCILNGYLLFKKHDKE